MLRTIFSYFPTIEVLARKIYKNYIEDSALKKYIIERYRTEKKGSAEPILLEQFKDSLIQMGIRQGDLLIVHSSIKGMEDVTATPKQIIEALSELLGPEGTLVMPAFPYYKQEKEEKAVLKYNPGKTLAWTGILPNVFLTMEGTFRSEYPNNSLAANGKYAKEMFVDEMRDNRSHGKYSAWNFCADHHAKVVFIGVKPDHALSEIHLGEDLLRESWPVEDWCETQNYLIWRDGKWQEKKCQVRRKIWTQYLTEEFCVRKLKNAGILQISDGICRGYIHDLKNLKIWLLEEIKKGDLVFYKIPSRYWKRETGR